MRCGKLFSRLRKLLPIQLRQSKETTLFLLELVWQQTTLTMLTIVSVSFVNAVSENLETWNRNRRYRSQIINVWLNRNSNTRMSTVIYHFSQVALYIFLKQASHIGNPTDCYFRNAYKLNVHCDFAISFNITSVNFSILK